MTKTTEPAAEAVQSREPAAQAVLDERRATVAHWETEASTKAAELADLEARVGAEVLADPAAADGLSGQMAALRAGIDVAQRAAVAAQALIPEAERGLWAAQAADKRAEAADLRAEVARRQRTTDRLLKQLREHEGVDYIPASTDWDDIRRRMVMEGPVTIAGQEFPTTFILARRADQLDQEAAQLEPRAVVPVAVPQCSIALRGGPRDSHTTDEMDITAHASVTPGDTEPVLFELLVAGSVVDNLTLPRPDAPQVRGGELRHVVSSRPLPDRVEVRVDGRMLAEREIPQGEHVAS